MTTSLVIIEGPKRATYTFRDKPAVVWDFQTETLDISSWGQTSPVRRSINPEYKVTLTSYAGLDITEEWFVNKKLIREHVVQVATDDINRLLKNAGDVDSYTSDDGEYLGDLLDDIYAGAPADILNKVHRYKDECWAAIEVSLVVGETATEKRKREKKERKQQEELARQSYSGYDYGDWDDDTEDD